MKKNFYRKVVIIAFFIISGFFASASSVHADYFKQGVLVSTNLLSGSSVDAVSSFRVTATVPANTTVNIQFSKDRLNFYNSVGTLWGWDSCADGTTDLDLSALGWSGLTGGSLFYKVQLTTTDYNATPLVSEIQLNYSGTDVPSIIPTDTVYRQGILSSTNLLLGATVTAINSFQVDADIPIGTTVSVKFSQDGINYFNSAGVQESFDSCASGITTVDLHNLNWSGGRFYYKIQLQSSIFENNMTPVVRRMNLDYDGTEAPPVTGFDNYLQGTLISTNLLAGSGEMVMGGGDKFGYNITFLPGTTAVEAQFSQDGANWFSSNGTAWGWDTLLFGDHTLATDALDLSGLNWAGGTSFYYKMRLTSSYFNSLSPIVNDAGYIYDRAVPQLGTLDLGFDEGTGGTAHDRSASQNDATLISGAGGTNATTTAMWNKNGKFGGAMEFDGTDDRLKIFNFNLPSADKFSIYQSINFQALATAKPIFSQWGNNYNNILVKTDDVNANQLRVCIADSLTDNCTNFAATTDANFVTGNWYNVAVIYDGTQTDNVSRLKIFVDGVQKTLSFSGTIPATLQNPLSTLEIGGDGDLGAYFTGRLDEIKTFNSALSQDEMKVLNNNSSALMFGYDTSRNNNGTPVTGTAKDYCIPGDTAKCDAPVGEWKMDEGSGTTTYDTSGNGNNGTFTNGPIWTQGKFGKGVDFDGVNDYAQMASSSNYDSTNATWCVWFKTSGGFGTGTGTTTSTLLGRHTTAGSYSGVNLMMDAGGALSFQAKDGSGNAAFTVGTSTTYRDNIWHNVCGISASNGNTAYLYVDGIRKSSALTTRAWSFNSQVVRIADSIDTFWGQYNGLIDQVQIYNYARTSAQIAWDYNRGGPIAEWRFNECSGTTLHDESGNGNNGTLNLGASGQTIAGTCSANANTPWYNGRIGKYGASLNFDGTDDYVGIGTAITGVNAVSLWIKPTSTTQSIIDLDGGTHKISLAAGTVNATGFNSFYVDGKLSGTISDSSWHHIIAIANTAFNTTTGMSIGKISSAYFAGQIDNVKVFNYALTQAQIKTEYDGAAAVNFR